MARRTTLRNGFTLPELLVSCSVIAVLLGLAMLQVHSARESSRSLTCRNNLRQIGLALTNYHDTHRVYPVGIGGVLGRANSLYKVDHFSVNTRLLSFLDEDSLYGKINWDYDVEHSKNAHLRTLPSPAIFRCPSDDVGNRVGINLQICMGADAWMLNDDGVTRFRSKGYGVFQYERSNDAASVTDGLSHTVVFSERPKSSATDRTIVKGVARIANYDLSPIEANRWTHRCAQVNAAHESWRSYSDWWALGSNQGYNHILPPNYQLRDCTDLTAVPAMGMVTARSYHAGVANFLFASSRISQISDTIDLAVYRALATRAAGD